MDQYKNKNYLPIINFSTNRDIQATEFREKLISKINALIKENLDLDEKYESAISYLISEMSDNIIEHSGVENGWLSMQYYPTTQYSDLCIIDTGKTILGSYQDHDFKNIDNDEKALKAAIDGISTKDLGRGSGIRTTKAIASIGLSGDFLIYSGGTIYYRNRIINLNTDWHGTIIAIRIKKGIQNFSLYNYV